MIVSAGKAKVAAWWGLILLCIALILHPPWQDWAPKERSAGDERVTLAVLELQSRLLLGAAQTQPIGLEEKLAEMEAWAVTDESAAAVAALRFFIDPQGDGKWRALALVNLRLQAADAFHGAARNRSLLEEVRGVLEHPDQLSEEGREQILGQMGWFGEVLLAGMEPEGELAMALRKRSLLMVYVSGRLAVLAFVAALLGLVLLSFALYQLKEGQLELSGIAEGIPMLPFLAAFALFLALMVLSDFLSITVDPRIRFAGMFVPAGVAFVWPSLCGLTWRQSLRGFGWRRGKGVWREMGAGVVGYLAMAPVFALGLSATLILGILAAWLAKQGASAEPVEAAGHPVTHPIVAALADGGWKIKLAVLFLASGLAPLFEETLFRGALYGVFRKRWGFVLSALASGFIFAVIHPQGWVAIPALTSMGFGFAIIREWRGTVIASMTAHSLHNGILVCSLLLALS
ncbi:MAG: CPBP family intramembrane metalloprotease [Verrucomicrobiales bacterium]|nr:CPBP family intramembrane metalloprotease [Verrucomicrobiales bacterium]